MIDKGIPRHNYDIVDADGTKIGHVTSGTISPMSRIGIGMGYVKTAFSKKDTEIYISIRNKQLKARVMRPPFYKG
jgi:aminomethyltransferase